ncbi:MULTISPECIES: histidine phosphatase family protein [Inquilinus]|uniref:2,3-bisphosphoglycerate-dependent phosphoglycerate mutase n=1 Tax=Inquilinus ginsengisoli TaxID=363840 RepID=A0ABU1JP65_9PROT|nr:histidine phosphatase family protein [Inquilinus ginsengisoli]MDR6290413.1 2,3-bisphosphoglycerate-dependent phosphoglycerate mutase [Inquilinus ginsengisoli]
MTSGIYLIRHCRAAGQEPAAPLTEEGHAQALRLRDRLAATPIARVVSSPFLRARDSAAPLAARLGLPLGIDERLAERVLAADPAEDWRDRLRQSFADPGLRWPGGESGAEAMARGRAAVDAAAADAGGPVAVVTHGNLLALILHSFDGRSGFDTWAGLTNPDVYRIDPAGQVQRWWSDEG